MSNLLTITQVCELAGINRSTLGHHRANPKAKSPFPEPALTAGQSPLWNRADVEAWIVDRDATPGAAPEANR